MTGLTKRPVIFILADLADLADFSECYFLDAKIFLR